LWTTYTMLTEIEATFRSLKTDLGLRPVYHQKEDRVTGHLFITTVNLFSPHHEQLAAQEFFVIFR